MSLWRTIQSVSLVWPNGERPRTNGLPSGRDLNPNTCLYDFRVGDLDVQMRFSAALLSEWEKLNAGARGLIETARR